MQGTEVVPVSVKFLREKEGTSAAEVFSLPIHEPNGAVYRKVLVIAQKGAPGTWPLRKSHLITPSRCLSTKL